MKIVLLVIHVLLSTGVLSSAESAVNAQYIITQQDENEIIRLTEEFNAEVKAAYNPASSIRPYGDYEQFESFKKLLGYDSKLVPYLIRQIRINNEIRMTVGSAAAERDIKDHKDLRDYQAERADTLREGIRPWFGKFDGILGGGLPNWTIRHILSQTSIGKYESPKFRIITYKFRTRFSWIDWWDKNKGRFEFQTDNPLVIDTSSAFFDFPHISTEIQNDLLTIEAVHATYRQIIERVAAEAGVEVFIGENVDLKMITTVRMRAVTFEEFTHFRGYGYWLFRPGHGFRKMDNKYHFGGEEEAKPRKIYMGQGIMMKRTVFHEGDSMPVTIIARNLRERSIPVIIPLEPDSLQYGHVKITTNDGRIVSDYTQNKKMKQKIHVVEKRKDKIEFELDISKEISLSPGEYNVSFMYHEQETPTIAIEVYAKKAAP